MALEYIRISKQGKDQLMRIKRNTRVKNWNTICRWAFCVSIANPSVPSPVNMPADTAIDMEWKTFGGIHHDIYLALLKQRCYEDGLEINEDTLTEQFKLHLHRGIGYLAGNKEINDISGLLKQALASAKRLNPI